MVDLPGVDGCAVGGPDIEETLAGQESVELYLESMLVALLQ